jgi:hypothetical protein
MKLESQTLAILKNFANINPSICFKEGQPLRTISPGKTILAQATANSELPGTFAIYDLSRFLSVLSLFESPAITSVDTYLTITDERQTVNYTFADLSTITVPPDRTPVVDSAEIKFELTAEALLRAQKAMGVLGLAELCVHGNGSQILLKAVDSKKAGSDSFAIQVGTTDHNFNMIFKAENMKLMPGSYETAISSRGIAHFKSDVVEYWIATEASSTFGNK